MKSIITFLSIFCIVFGAMADSPIFWQRYTADPTAIAYGGRIYMYCSHDTYSPETGYGYHMKDVTLISSDDLKNWTDHGEVFSIKNAAWGPVGCWAPTVVERNGKFYLYYGNRDQSIGVAVSDSPTGPFVDSNKGPVVSKDTPGIIKKDKAGNPLKEPSGIKGALGGAERWGMWCFDPCVFIDDDGKAYMYLGGAHPNNSRIVKLKDNMVEADGEAICPDTPGFFEASFMHKYNGKYYYSYSGHYFNNPCNIDYVVASKPTGPFKKIGVVLENPPVNDGYNSHHSIFKFNGDWYIAYHNRQVAYEKGENDRRSREYMRSVCLDRIYHNPDGTIQQVKVSRDGLPQLKYVNPYVRNEAETMAKGWKINTTAKSDEPGNRVVNDVENNGYIKVRGVDFRGKKAGKFLANVSSASLEGGEIEIRLEGEEGVLLGKLLVSPTGGTEKWQLIETDIKSPSDIHDLYLVFKGKGKDFLRLDYWEFL